MRNYIFLIAIPALLCGCSLKEQMVSASTADEYYTNELQCISALNACYQPLRAIYNSKDYFQICELQTDIMYSSRKDQYNAILQVSPAAPQFGSTMWKNGYLGVMRANAVISRTEKSGMDDNIKLPVITEAVIMRAMFYYILTCNFGDVPFYKEEVTDENNERIARLPRMSAHETRNALIDELREWVIDRRGLEFKATNASDNSRQYRCGAALGLYLAGKMCLWEERWTEAIEFFGYLEDIYGNGRGNPQGSLDGYKLSDIAFNRPHSPEVILEIPNIAIEYGLQLYGSIASYATPIRSDSVDEDMIEDPEYENLETNDIYAGVRIPELGQFARTHVPIRPARKFWKRLMPWDSPDKRRSCYEITATKTKTNPGPVIPIEDGGGFLAWGWPGYDPDEDGENPERLFRLFSDVKTRSYRPYLGNKFWCFGMQYTMDNNSYKAFRFAGALLGLSEAWLQKGDAQKACDYLNVIKSRAGIALVSPSDFASDADLFHEIQDEYARELFGEFQRKHDLVRWGIWYETVMEFNVAPYYGPSNEFGGENNKTLGANIKPCHEYYPIPDEQITYSSGALDNKEYNKYGL